MIERAGDTGVQASLRLSPREADVLAKAARGLTNGQVAADLQVSIHAVKFHLASVYRKLGVTNRTEAAVRYLQAVDSLARMPVPAPIPEPIPGADGT
jgi:DNA-binding CsgD family transcriptional regulator